MRNYKNLEIWKKGYHLVILFYKLIAVLPEEEKHNLKHQLRRALTSIPLNIAEGASSRSNRVFLKHLGYAYASAKEVEVVLMLCKDLKFISNEEYYTHFLELEEVKAKLYKFMLAVEKEVKTQPQGWSPRQNEK